jgi:hypothetical protein
VADPPGYEALFEKYRKMLKMGLPEGSVRNKATQDGCSDEVMDYFFTNCAGSSGGGGGGGGGGGSTAVATGGGGSTAVATSQPATTQVCLFEP